MKNPSEHGQGSQDAWKQKYIDRTRNTLSLSGVLSPDEIDEYINYEFGEWPITVGQQVRRYYLKMKDQRLPRADEFLVAVGEIDETTMDAARAKDVMRTVGEYVSGGVIHYDDELYHKYGTGTVSLEVGSAATGHLVAWSAPDPTTPAINEVAVTMGEVDTFGLRPDEL